MQRAARDAPPDAATAGSPPPCPPLALAACTSVISRILTERRLIEERRVAAVKAEKAARAFGDVALQADGYTAGSAGFPGIFELQAAAVQGRPTYKKDAQAWSCIE